MFSGVAGELKSCVVVHQNSERLLVEEDIVPIGLALAMAVLFDILRMSLRS